jgi:hypothetical protein
MATTKVTNRVLEVDSVGTAQLSAGAVQQSFGNTSGAFSFRNKIINGNFDIWQRGTSLTSGTGGRYLADRWSNVSNGTTYTVSQQSFTPGQTSVPNEPIYFHRVVVTSVAGSSNECRTTALLEDVRTLAGKVCTLSFWAKADSNKPIAIEIVQNFGTGGSPSSLVRAIVAQKVNLTASWQKITITANIPSINGKVLGSDNNHHLAILFYYDAGSDLNSQTNSLGQQSGTFDLAQVQLEEGSVATPFEQRPIGTELALCQRYYWRPNPTGGAGVSTASQANIVNFFITYPTTMRATPQVIDANDPPRFTPLASYLNVSCQPVNGYNCSWTALNAEL